MTIASNQSTPKAAPKRMTLEEYLNYDDCTDTRYELRDERLVDMGAESDVNVVIGSLLFSPSFCKTGKPGIS